MRLIRHMALIGLLLAVISIPAICGADDSLDFSDWDLEKRSYNGYIDLYITPRDTVQFIEYCLVVNYMDQNVTMVNEGNNKTFNTFIISPKTSKFLQLDFNNYNTTFFIKFIVNDSVVFQISKNTEAYKFITNPTPIIPAPGPVTPSIPTTEPSEPEKTYNETEVQKKKVEWTKELILIIVAGSGFMAILGIVSGHYVKLKTKFKYPTEFITASLMVFLTIEVLFRPIPVALEYRIIYFPFIACYFLGFAITKLNYQNLEFNDLEICGEDTEEIVFDYDLDTHKQYYYPQTWKSLYLRLVGGKFYTPQLNTDYSLHNANWKGSKKTVSGSKENYLFIPVHKQHEQETKLPKLWPFKTPVIINKNIELVHGGNLSGIHFKAKRDAYIYAIEELNLTTKAFVYHLVSCNKNATRKAAMMLIRGDQASPSATIIDTIKNDLEFYTKQIESKYEKPYTKSIEDLRTKKELEHEKALDLIEQMKETVKNKEINPLKNKELKDNERKKLNR